MPEKNLTPARRAARTLKTRKEFVSRFSESSLTALRDLLRGRSFDFSPQSMAAYRANLTRGVYDDFIRVTKNGKLVKDRLNIKKV